MYFLCLILFISGNVIANVGDYFASSASTMAIGGQANFNSNDAANNHYAGSLLTDQNHVAYSFNFLNIQTHFKKINDIVVSSPVNSSENKEVYGDVNTDYAPQSIFSAHGSFDFIKKFKTKLNLSAYIPTGKLLEASTGDPYRPEYVMYRSRFLRSLFLINLARNFEAFAFSVGALSGFQSNGKTYVIAQESADSTPPSSGKLTFNATPSLALTFSLAKKLKQQLSVYFSFQDEMRNRLTNHASGYTPIGASSLKYDWDLSTMLYYDPRIYRLGSQMKVGEFHLYTSLEYQDWSGYKSPILEMADNGGILKGSRNSKNFKTINIFIPKIGIDYQQEKNTYLAGISFRPSPIDLIKGAGGNTVDADASILSLGYIRQAKFFSQSFQINSAIQYHQLKTLTISKDANRENGDSGLKIGADKYQVGGSVFTVSFGISWII